ncbi:MAG: polymer-forming cytoskeletal protein [Acidobacteria bacterium]|nr:polymer-forming cytoskeletal protein [Acidobacteriota bacterium]
MNRWMSRAVVAALVVLSLPASGHGQGASDLAARLRERYDVVALQQGVALVPRQPGGAVRLIQIEGGVVSVDGQTLTGAQLRERLGADADLVVQASYLTPQQQRELAGQAGAPSPSTAGAPIEPPRLPERTDVRRGDIFRFGDGVTVAANERVEGDVIVFGGPATVDGEVTGDVHVFGGPVRLGPQAVVRGDVTAFGGGIDRAAGARVNGDVNEVGGPRGGGGTRRRWMFSQMFGPSWSRVGSLAATVLRLTVVILVGLVLIAFGRGAIERIAARTAGAPVRSGLIGLLAEILFVPVLILTCVVLVVSIVGIPLLALVPFAVLLLILVMLVGFVGLGYQVGRLVASRLGRREPGPYAAFAIGVVTIGAVTLIAKLAALVGGFLLAPLTVIGYILEYIAWTVGFGAALLYWYETQTRFGTRRATPPAAPPTPSEA